MSDKWQDFNYSEWKDKNDKFDHTEYDQLSEQMWDSVDNIQDIIDMLPDLPKNPPWRPNTFYNAEGDILHVYLSNEESYAKWLNPKVTVLLSRETDEIVGINIGGLLNTLARDRSQRTVEILKKIISLPLD